VTLLLLPSGSLAPLGPLWAALCGAWAATWQWQREPLLALVLTLFTVEVLWSTWRAQLIDINWARDLVIHPLPARGDPLPALPYTTPWSPLGRLLGRWGRVRRWLRETVSAEHRGALIALIVLPPIILLLSGAIGPRMLALSVAALSLSAIEWRLARQGHAHRALQAGLEIGLSWIAGHQVFGPLTWISFALACSYALAYQGALSLGHADRAWSLGLLYGGQALAALWLLLPGHPSPANAAYAALGAALLLVPQLLLLSRFEAHGREAWYVPRAAPFVMAAMALAAWVV
jgi:hypothetical protein